MRAARFIAGFDHADGAGAENLTPRGEFVPGIGVTARAVILASTTAAPFVAAWRLVPVVPALSLPDVALHLLRTPRRRGSEILRELGDLVAAAIEAGERTVREASRRPVPRRRSWD